MSQQASSSTTDQTEGSTNKLTPSVMLESLNLQTENNDDITASDEEALLGDHNSTMISGTEFKPNSTPRQKKRIADIFLKLSPGIAVTTPNKKSKTSDNVQVNKFIFPSSPPVSSRPKFVPENTDLAHLIKLIEGQNKKSDAHNLRSEQRTEEILNEVKEVKCAAEKAYSLAASSIVRINEVETRVDSNQRQQLLLEDRVERDRRAADLIVQGIPLVGKQSRDDLLQMTVHIGRIIGVKVEHRDILFVRVIPSNLLVRYLIRFVHVGIRSEFFRAYFTFKGGLRFNHLGFKGNDRVYIADNLTLHNSAIRKRAITLTKEGRLSGHSIRDGIVHITTDKNKKKPIYDISDLDKISIHNQVNQVGVDNVN